MKEIVDRILNGEAVDIAGAKADYFLTVSKNGENYKIGFTYPENMKSFHSCVGLKSIREAGKLLIALADELESRKKFSEGYEFYYIDADGTILRGFFKSNNAVYYSLVMFGNAFKTEVEAKANRKEIMAKFQELRDRGLV
nr:MAG TPA: hypothetical protein [Caudoviricetes sp.]